MGGGRTRRLLAVGFVVVAAGVAFALSRVPLIRRLLERESFERVVRLIVATLVVGAVLTSAVAVTLLITQTPLDAEPVLRIVAASVVALVVMLASVAVLRPLVAGPRQSRMLDYGCLASPALMFVVAIAVIFVVRETALSPTSQPSPEQPVAFPHTMHVKVFGLDCSFCHRTATTAAPAGMPAVEQCMFCHRVVQPPTNPEIMKVVAAWQDGQPIEWTRVHQLPDHTHFVHEAHMSAGFTCDTCHGDVGSMEEVRQVRDLRMLDCVECHRETGAPTDCSTCHY